MELKGKILQVMEPTVGQGKKGQWAKQDFILDLGGQYPKKVCISLWGQEKIDKYDLEVGLSVTVHIEIESREYNGRWYTDVRAWKIQWDNKQRRWSPSGEESAAPKEDFPDVGGSSDDLPF